jgi:hypothetical protein
VLEYRVLLPCWNWLGTRGVGSLHKTVYPNFQPNWRIFLLIVKRLGYPELLKGTVTRDFRSQVLFHELTQCGAQFISKIFFEFGFEFAELFEFEIVHQDMIHCGTEHIFLVRGFFNHGSFEPSVV